MRELARNHAHQGRDSIVPIHELEPQVLKMPRLRSIRHLNPNKDISGSELTERALSTLPTDESGIAQEKNCYSITSDDDDDGTFSAEFSDFG